MIDLSKYKELPNINQEECIELLLNNKALVKILDFNLINIEVIDLKEYKDKKSETLNKVKFYRKEDRLSFIAYYNWYLFKFNTDDGSGDTTQEFNQVYGKAFILIQEQTIITPYSPWEIF